jgi:hypothetical protein
LSYFPNWYQTALTAKDPLALELKETLTEWAVRHGLEYGWMSEVVVHTLSAWVTDPRLEESRRWFLASPIDFHPMTYGEQVIEFSTHWDPFTTSRKKAKTQIIADFEADLERQLSEIEARSKERGIQEIPEKRKLAKHLTWLVQYQVMKRSFSIIAKDAGLKFAEEQGHKTVAPAVRSTAQVIGLQPLRENDPGGRPTTSR